MILYNEFELFSKLVNSEFYNDFETFSKLVHENENENVSTNKILGSLEILAIKNKISFKDVQMILLPFYEILSDIGFTKKSLHCTI